MHVTAGLGAAVEAANPLRVVAVMEATRVTGIARNVLEYAKLARLGMTGLQVALTLAVIRRGREELLPPDGLLTAARAARIPAEILRERHRYDALLLERLRRTVDAHRPDIIETHHVKSHCLVVLSGLWHRYRWGAFHHGYTRTDFKVCAYNQLDRWSLRFAAHVVTTNRRFARMLERRGVARRALTVLHNGVRETHATAEEGAALRARLGLAAGDRVVLTVGRLSFEKGQMHAIRAALAWRDRARLVIAGDGPDRPALERLARNLGLEDRVVFAGLTRDVAPFYALADVFVLPSLSEGSPNVLLEAMASGLPIVATDVGGVPEIAADEVNALLVPAEDAAAMGRSVLRLLNDSTLGSQLGRMARQTVTEHYTPEQRAAALTRVYAHVAGRYGRGSATTAPAFVP